MPENFETKRLTVLADHHDLQSSDHLDAFLANDVKTRDDETLRNRWRLKMQAAVPRLRDRP